MITQLEQDPQTMQSFAAYTDMLRAINERSPQHQGLLAEEYVEALHTPGVVKTEVQYSGEQVAIPQLAPPKAFGWLHAPYFEQHFPNETQNNNILHYTDFEGVEPGAEVKGRISELAQHNGVLVIDYPDSDETYRDRVVSFLASQGVAISEEATVGTQTYYGGQVELKREHAHRDQPISLYQAYEELLAKGEIAESERVNGTVAELVIEGEEADKMYGFFKDAYDTISDHPCAQALSPEEFREKLGDDTVTKIVYRNNGVAESMCMITNDLEGLGWVNADFYAKKYPEKYANKEVIWFPGIATDPDPNKQGRNLPKIVERLSQLAEAADYEPVVVFDTPDINKGFLDVYIEHEAAKLPYLNLKFDEIGMQNYTALRLQPAPTTEQ